MRSNSFKRDERGVTLIVVAIMLALIIGILAITLDLTKSQNVALKNKTAVDASALATAELLLKLKIEKIADPAFVLTWKDYLPPQDEIEKYALNNYKINFAKDNTAYVTTSSGEVKFEKFTVVVRDNHVIVTACPYAKDLNVRQAQGHEDTMKVCSSSDAWIRIDTQLHDLEVAFSLDYTWSMIYPGTADSYVHPDDPRNYTYQRFDSLETSFNSIIDEFFINPALHNIKISLTPFGSTINLTNYADNFILPNPGKTYTYNPINPPAPVTLTVDMPDTIPAIDIDNVDNIMAGGTFHKVPSFDKLFDVYFPLYTDSTLYPYYGTDDRHEAQQVINNALTVSTRPELAIQPLTTNVALLKEQVKKMRLASIWSRFFGQFIGDQHSVVHIGTSGQTGLIGAWWTISPQTNGLWNRPSPMETNPTVLNLDPAQSTCLDTTTYPNADPYILLGIPSVQWRTWAASGNPTQTATNLVNATMKTDPNTNAQIPGIPAGCQIKFTPINSASTATEDRSNLPAINTESVKKYIIHITDGEDNWYGQDGNHADISGRDGDIIYKNWSGSKNANDPTGESGASLLAATAPNDEEYTKTCDAIKADHVEIFIILYTDNDTPNPAKQYHRSCISGQNGGNALHLYENVTPGALLTTLKQIMDVLVSRSAYVQLAR